MEEKKEIKGILHLESESDLWDEAVKKKEESLGIKASFDWELDRISVYLEDKDGCDFGTLVFNNTDFQSKVEDVMPPSKLPEDKEYTEEEKKEIEKYLAEDVEEMKKNPVKEEIAKYHNDSGK